MRNTTFDFSLIQEIGIRKVLGATIYHLWKMLTGDFVKLVTLSCLLASPVAYYILSNWLRNYEYRTDLHWWVFALPGVAALIIAVLTVSFQTIRAARLNPVNSLRSE